MTYLDILEGDPHHSNSPILLAVAKCFCHEGKHGFFQVVVFERSDVAHVGPSFYRAGGLAASQRAFVKHRQAWRTFRRTTWAVAILALATSPESKAFGLVEAQALSD